MSLEIALARIKEAKEYNQKVLDLSELDLEEIPKEIGELEELTHLFLQKNRIKNLQPLTPLKKLRVLALHDNQIQEIPSFLLDLQQSFLWGEIEKSDLLNIIKNYNLKLNSNLDHLCSNVLALHPVLDESLSQDLTPLQVLARALSQGLVHDLNLARDLAFALDLAQYRTQYRSIVRDLTRDLFQDRGLA